MTVSEFINVWQHYFKSNFPMKVTFNNMPTTLYKLSFENSNLKSFKLEINLDKNINEYSIYSDEYDLDEVPKNVTKILDSLKIETYDNVYTSTLILHIEGGE